MRFFTETDHKITQIREREEIQFLNFHIHIQEN